MHRRVQAVRERLYLASVDRKTNSARGLISPSLRRVCVSKSIRGLEGVKSATGLVEVGASSQAKKLWTRISQSRDVGALVPIKLAEGSPLNYMLFKLQKRSTYAVKIIPPFPAGRLPLAACHSAPSVVYVPFMSPPTPPWRDDGEGGDRSERKRQRAGPKPITATLRRGVPRVWRLAR